MVNSPGIELYKDVLDELFTHINATEWHVDGEPLTIGEMAAPDGFMPAWGSVAATTAINSGLIQHFDQFPLEYTPSDQANFGVIASVAEFAPEQGLLLPHSVALLFLSDAVYYALSLNDRTTLETDRRVDLSPLLIQLEMSEAPDAAQQPTL